MYRDFKKMDPDEDGKIHIENQTPDIEDETEEKKVAFKEDEKEEKAGFVPVMKTMHAHFVDSNEPLAYLKRVRFIEAKKLLEDREAKFQEKERMLEELQLNVEQQTDEAKKEALMELKEKMEKELENEENQQNT